MNRRAFVAAALATAIDPPAALSALEGGGSVALVTADLESHVAAVELSSGRVVGRVRTVDGPRSIESTPFGYAVVAHTSIGRVSLLDTRTLSVGRVLDGFGEPRYTAMHPAERLAYVTDSQRGEVVTIDLPHARIVHRERVPGPARHVALDADAALLWTALGTKAQRIAVLTLVDPRRPRLVRMLSPPFLAHDVVAAPDGRHVWVTSGSKNAVAIYRLAGGPPRVLTAAAPPQHVAFAERRAYLASGADGSLELRRLDGTVLRTARVPHGSYNVTYESPRSALGRPAAATPSLDRGTLCVLSPAGAVRLVRRVARSAHDACITETA
jgi:DNA-binding beta-propeller fold protein YncE